MNFYKIVLTTLCLTVSFLCNTAFVVAGNFPNVSEKFIFSEAGNMYSAGKLSSNIVACNACVNTILATKRSEALVDTVICYTIDNTGSRVPESKSIFSYDSNGKLSGRQFMEWDGTAWIYTETLIYSYDTDGNLIELRLQLWDGINWVDHARYTNSYDADGNLIVQLYQEWDGSGWFVVYQVVYTFDADGNLLSEMDQEWVNGAWLDHYEFTYTYNADGLVESELERKFADSLWSTEGKITFIYDTEQNKTGELKQMWDGSAWLDYETTNYTYDVNGNVVNVLIQTSLNGSWENSINIIYTYNTEGYLVNITEQIWDGANWVNSSECDYIYADMVTGIDLAENSNYDVMLYPNPFINSLTVQVKNYAAGNSDEMQFMLYDLTGNKIEDVKFSVAYELQRNNLPRGIYLFQISVNGQIISNGKLLAE